MTDKKDIYEVPDSDDERANEEQLQKAIALSMEQSQSPPQNPLEPVSEASGKQGAPQVVTTKRKLTHVDLTIDDEDSGVPVKAQKLSSEITVTRTKLEATTSIASVAKSDGLAGLSDRKEMEKARLGRAQRRAQSQSLEPVNTSKSASNQGSRDTSEASTPVEPGSFYGPSAGSSRWKAVRTSSIKPAPKSNADSSRASSSSSSRAPSPPSLQYPNGVVKKTWVDGCKRTGDEVTIEEVLQVNTLTTTVLSAFQWDLGWIYNKLPLRKRDFQWVAVMQGKTEEEKKFRAGDITGLPRVTVVFPDMSGQINCMHSKLMLLFHKEGNREWLRIAVPTANLTEYDWGGTGGLMENMVFMIDLPSLPEPQPEQTIFLEELLYFTGAQGFPDEILSQLVMYDFKKTEGMAFVHSVGGSSGGDNWKRTGYCGLGTSIRKLKYASGKGLEVDFVTSSLGSANESFISNIYRAAMGENGSKELYRRTNKKATASKTKKNSQPLDENTDDESGPELEEETDWERIKKRFRIYFPSHDTVNHSRGGIQAGGTICFQPQWWNSATFPRDLVQDCKSIRTGVLMHNKLLFARPASALSSPAGEIDAWAYVGSANLSESAWGKLVIDRSTKSPKINCKNWECGVIVPVLAKSTGQTLSGVRSTRAEPLGMEVFNGTVPVPMQFPSGPLNNKEPWFFAKSLREMGLME